MPKPIRMGSAAGAPVEINAASASKPAIMAQMPFVRLANTRLLHLFSVARFDFSCFPALTSTRGSHAKRGSIPAVRPVRDPLNTLVAVLVRPKPMGQHRSHRATQQTGIGASP